MNKYQAIGGGSLLTAAVTAGTVYNCLPTNIPNIEQPLKAESISRDQESNPNINLDKQEEEGDSGLLENLDEKSIGFQYKDYLIGSKLSNEPGKRKMEIGKENIKRDKADKPFEGKGKRDPDYEKLKTRCSNAYRKNQWNFNNNVKDKFAREKYGAMVGTMCGKEKMDSPSNGGDY